MAKCPKTAAEAFKRLDKRLGEEEKKAIREAEDMCIFHFDLGLWIRNNWFYCGEDENVGSLIKDLGGDMPVVEVEGKIIVLGGGDDFSSVILDAYQKHLKEIAK